MLEQDLKELILIKMDGIAGNNFVPFANHGGHNYRTGVSHPISRTNGRGNGIRGFRDYAEDEGNTIVLHEEARLIYTEKGISNILSNIKQIKLELDKLSQQFTEIQEKVQRSGPYDPKTEQLESMLVMLRDKNTDPAIIIDKLLKAINSGW